MCKHIGKVTLDYTYYKGKDLYTDGSIEDKILEIVKEERENEALHSGAEWPILYHLSDIRENLLEWYPFSKNCKILEIGSGCGALTGLLSQKAKEVTCIELSEKRSLINAFRNQKCSNVKIMIGNFQDIEIKDKYEYITLIGVWEYAGLYVKSSDPYLEMLKKIKKYLAEDGKIIIAIENKTGMKYWNGATEDHTGCFYSGLNDYIDDRNIRTFSRPEIERLLKKAGISRCEFYYPMPDYKLPETIYSDRELPKPGSERNYRKEYSTCRIYNFYDDAVSDQVCSDGMFPYFSNSFLIVTGEKHTQKYYERYNRLRKEQYRIKTEIFEKNYKKYSRKRALNTLALKHISNLKINENKWVNCLPNINYVEGILENGDYLTPYIEGTDLDTVFYEYRNDIDLFIERFQYYIKRYLKPEEKDLIPFSVSEDFVGVFGKLYPSNKMALKCTNADLIFSNLKLTLNEELYCFDYEWIFDFLIPYEYVVWRSASQLYDKYMIYLRNRISRDDFFVRIGFPQENLFVYEQMEKNFHMYVYGNEDYLKNYRKSSMTQKIRFM
ncbi:MAG: class I SAM-dependent methyltransferase [Lachnospiraceae bacterium]